MTYVLYKNYYALRSSMWKILLPIFLHENHSSGTALLHANRRTVMKIMGTLYWLFYQSA